LAARTGALERTPATYNNVVAVARWRAVRAGVAAAMVAGKKYRRGCNFYCARARMNNGNSAHSVKLGAKKRDFRAVGHLPVWIMIFSKNGFTPPMKGAIVVAQNLP
jgi:hypothetical protein